MPVKNKSSKQSSKSRGLKSSLASEINPILGSAKTLLESGFLKGLLAVVTISAIVVVGGNYAGKIITGDEDFNTLQALNEKLDEMKNGPHGCCYPYCSNTGEAECGQEYGVGGRWFSQKCNKVSECQKGCCLPKCENLPKVQCSQEFGTFPAQQWVEQKCEDLDECKNGCCQTGCKVMEAPKALCEYGNPPGIWNAGKCQTGCCQNESGNQQLPQHTCLQCISDSNWYEGECGKGYSIHLEGSSGGEADLGQEVNSIIKIFTGGGIDTQVNIALDLYTCSDKPLSTWKGKSTVHTKASNPKVQEKDKTETHDMTLPFNPDGTIHNAMTQSFAKLFDARLEGNQMTIKYNMLLIEPIVMTGTIKPGAKECQNGENKN